jgi:hypothetical protein
MPPEEDDEVEEDELWLSTLWLSSFDIIILFKSLGGGLTGSVFEKDLDEEDDRGSMLRFKVRLEETGGILGNH